MRDRNGVKHCVCCDNIPVAATVSSAAAVDLSKAPTALLDDDDFNGDDDKLVYEKYAQQILSNSKVAVRDVGECQVKNAVLDKVSFIHPIILSPPHCLITYVVRFTVLPRT